MEPATVNAISIEQNPRKEFSQAVFFAKLFTVSEKLLPKGMAE